MVFKNVSVIKGNWKIYKKQKLRQKDIYTYIYICYTKGFLDDSVVKNLRANAGDVGSTPRLRRSPAKGNGNGRAWRVTIYGVVIESDMTQRLNNNNKPI